MSTIDRLTNKSTVLYFKDADATEPKRGSIVMTQGLEGTAWHRHHSDGLWHSSTGKIATWNGLFRSASPLGVALILDSDGGVDKPEEPATQDVQVTIYVKAKELVSGSKLEDHEDKVKGAVAAALRLAGLTDVKVLDVDVEEVSD